MNIITLINSIGFVTVNNKRKPESFQLSKARDSVQTRTNWNLFLEILMTSKVRLRKIFIARVLNALNGNSDLSSF